MELIGAGFGRTGTLSLKVFQLQAVFLNVDSQRRCVSRCFALRMIMRLTVELLLYCCCKLLQTALEILDLPCYHMVDVIERNDVGHWLDAAEGEDKRLCDSSTLVLSLLTVSLLPFPAAAAMISVAVPVTQNDIAVNSSFAHDQSTVQHSWSLLSAKRQLLLLSTARPPESLHGNLVHGSN